jgi:hypothetical protein
MLLMAAVQCSKLLLASASTIILDFGYHDQIYVRS